MEDLIPIIVIAAGVLIKFLSSRKTHDDEPGPAAPPPVSVDTLKEMLKRSRGNPPGTGENTVPVPETPPRRVVITRDDGRPLRSAPVAVARPAAAYDASADAEILERQRRYAELAALAEARNAAEAIHAMPPLSEAESEAEVYALPVENAADESSSPAGFIREHRRYAVILSEVLAPPPGLAESWRTQPGR